MDNPRRPPSRPEPEPRVDIMLHRAPIGGEWQAEVSLDGRHLHFDTLLALIGWLSRLDAPHGGIR